AHYAPPVCVIASPLIDGALLFIWAGVIAWIADRRKSEVMAVFAVGLAFFTSVITRVGEFTLYSNLLLTIAAVVFLVRNRWAGLSFAGLITSYVGYGCWRFLHETDWHWAPPVEHFFLGVAFLACYWVVFTAAAFLSRSERLSGSSRAAFLTLNNGAYFVLFLLSMLQVQLGGFWKFSLGYGTVLLALAALAIKVLPSEPLTRSAYLTQGLVLVTLGFIAKFSGLNLALVLGAESVVLFMLGVERQSRVLKFFGHAAAWLATGWCGFALTPFETQAGYMAVGLGLLLAANAGGALWSESRPGRISNRLESTLFTLLAFAGWAMAAWSNTTDPHLSVALVLALASVVFYNVIGGQKFVVPKVAAYLGAASAVIWGLVTLRRFDQAGLWFGIAVGGFLLLNAWRAQRECADNPQPLRLEPTAFAVLALAGWLAATWSNTTQANLPLVLAAEAVAFTFSIYLLRVREVTLLGQSFLLLAQAAWVFDSVNATPPWWKPFAIIAVTLGLSHWWQHPKWIPRRPETDPCMRGPWRQIALLYRWLALGMSLLWLWDYVPERQRIWACTLAAACLFALALGRQLREALAAAAVYAVAALALLWLRDGLVMDIYWPNLLSMLALLAMQQWLRRRPAQLPLDDRVHAAAVLLVGSSLWRFLSCWTALSLMGYSVTLIWAVYAVLVFAAGIVLHERYFRWFGLAVLAAAIGRVAFVDFWNEGTVSRVLTILALGIAFLVVGFLYNKFQEKIRRWL
ncbi:MAG TPA: hypothetical protein VL970_00990, partial [Candidatus Acidoferrales bacterium]|nr:hypothetical protein [Candidatus Acidoferrales bacterium]